MKSYSLRIMMKIIPPTMGPMIIAREVSSLVDLWLCGGEKNVE